MIQGIRINVDGTFASFNYTPLEMIERRLDIHTRSRGTGEYTLIDEYHSDRVAYLVYGWLNGTTFNQFDIDSCNPYGDMICIGIDEEFVPIDINLIELMSVFAPIDLDDYLIQDELDLGEDDYDYTDGFVIRDDTDEDSLGSIGYPDTPSNSEESDF